MCGLFCFVSNERVSFKKREYTEIMKSMNHRGPDSEGTISFKNKGVFLAHKRLSIIDLSTNGNQPMTLDGTTIIFNGEIYNYQELIKSEKIDLDDLKSYSDTEVLLFLYQKHGIEFVKLLKGMWAFILFDNDKDIIYASRDRVGMKPLYYAINDHGIIISSEIKSILSSGLYDVKMDFDALNEYMSFQNIISDRTLFQGIRILMPGHNIKYSIIDKKLKISEYWDLNLSRKENITLDAAKKKLDALIDQSIKRHLIGDRKIGVTLSGGIDSSIVLKFASKKIKKIDTFTGYFDYAGTSVNEVCNNEDEDAKKISRIFVTKHHELKIYSSDVLSNINSLAWHLEDPRVGASFTFYLISRLVSQNVTVNLSGTGGDELFGGYTWRLKMIDGLSDFNFENEYYEISQRLINDKEKSKLFVEKVFEKINPHAVRDEFNKYMKRVSNLSRIDKTLYFEFKTLLHGFLLVEDKLGMASSIETRFPLLDYDIIDFASTLPNHYKYSSGKSKIILKEIAKEFLPVEILKKKKQGFTPPELTWYGKDLKDELEFYLTSNDSRLINVVNRNYIKEVLQKVSDGIDLRAVVWSFVYLEAWIRVFNPINVE